MGEMADWDIENGLIPNDDTQERPMKTIIAGGRDQHITFDDWEKLDELPITEVVSGGARGIDTDGESYAEARGIPIKRFPAEWNKYGRSAGMRRNHQMAEYADAIVLFPGGRGTENMYQTAKKMGLTIYDWRKTKNFLERHVYRY